MKEYEDKIRSLIKEAEKTLSKAEFTELLDAITFEMWVIKNDLDFE